MSKIALLKQREEILAFSYWENFKFYKEIAQVLGGSHPETVRLNKECNDIQLEWHAISKEIKEFENL